MPIDDSLQTPIIHFAIFPHLSKVHVFSRDVWLAELFNHP